MKYVLLASILQFFIMGSVFSQKENIDSLTGITARLPEGREKAENYIKLVRYYVNTNRDSLEYYAGKAEQLAAKIQYLPVMADVLHIKAIMLKFRGQVDEALVLNRRFLAIADSIHDDTRLAKGYLNRGDLLVQRLELDSALFYYRNSLPFFRQSDDSTAIGAVYNAVGNVFLTKAEYDSAVYYYVHALIIYDDLKKEGLQLLVLKNLSKSYLQLGQLDQAKTNMLRCLDYHLQRNNKVDIAGDYSTLGIIANEARVFNEALDYYSKALDLFIQLKDTISISQMRQNIGLIYFHMDQYDQAIRYYDLAYQGFTYKKDTLGIIVLLGNKAVALGHEGKCREAIVLNEQALNLSRQFGTRDYYKDALENLSWCWMKLGDYEKAYRYQSMFMSVKDSIFDLEKTKVINDLTMKYEKEKDQAKILQLENENLEKDLSLRKRTSQRNGFFSAGILIFAMALFLLLYFRQRARKDKIIAEQKIRQLEEEKKLMAAKLLVEGQEEERKRIARELHDGLGVLLSATKMQFTSIKDTSPENQPLIKRATQLLDQATSDVRKISHNMMPGLLTKLGLYEATEDLIDNLNDSGTIKAVCDIEESLERLPENQEIMLYRIFQEMVNNTLKHAEATNILLRIRKISGMMEIIYSDDGKGFEVDKAMVTENQGLGLKSIQSRVNFLGGQMDIQSAVGQGTTYTIRIPVGVTI